LRCPRSGSALVTTPTPPQRRRARDTFMRGRRRAYSERLTRGSCRTGSHTRSELAHRMLIVLRSATVYRPGRESPDGGRGSRRRRRSSRSVHDRGVSARARCRPQPPSVAAEPYGIRGERRSTSFSCPPSNLPRDCRWRRWHRRGYAPRRRGTRPAAAQSWRSRRMHFPWSDSPVSMRTPSCIAAASRRCAHIAAPRRAASTPARLSGPQGSRRSVIQFRGPWYVRPERPARHAVTSASAWRLCLHPRAPPDRL